MAPTRKVCDYLVIGGGSGGLASARRANRMYGASTILVEAKKLGGTCVNVGCIPKKITWHAASLRGTLKEAKKYGLSFEETSPFNWEQFSGKRAAYVKKLNAIHETNLVVDGVEYLSGLASFVDSHNVQVVLDDGTAVEIAAKTILIAVGGHPSTPSIVGSEFGITSDGFFELDHQPKKMAIVGAGYIAVEMAGMVHTLGTETHMFIRHENFLRSFDPMVRDELMQEYGRQGIKVHKKATLTKIEDIGNGWKRVHYNGADGSRTGDFDCILWAIGRSPNVERLNLEVTNVQLNTKKHIKVDRYQNTNIDHIKSVGDVCDRGFELTPVAIAAGRRLADRLFGSKRDSFLEYETIPSVVFSHPEVGSIGLPEPAAREKYGEKSIKVYGAKFTPLYYALFDTNAVRSRTSYKLICAGVEEKVVGLHTVGLGSSELLQGFGVAIKMGATKQDFDRCVAIHPTSAEELVTLT